MEQIPQQIFTEQELIQYNGSRKMPVYVAYKGIVYDATTSTHWRTGEHHDLHYAGQDLTRACMQNLRGYPRVLGKRDLPANPIALNLFAYTL